MFQQCLWSTKPSFLNTQIVLLLLLPAAAAVAPSGGGAAVSAQASVLPPSHGLNVGYGCGGRGPRPSPASAAHSVCRIDSRSPPFASPHSAASQYSWLMLIAAAFVRMLSAVALGTPPPGPCSRQ